jgi:hypothetical protein
MFDEISGDKEAQWQTLSHQTRLCRWSIPFPLSQLSLEDHEELPLMQVASLL